MSFLNRSITDLFHKRVLPNKVLILLGARRVGKTAFIKDYLSRIPKEDYLQLNGEDINDVNLIKECSVNNYSRLLTNVKILVINEAQNIPDIGMILKLIVDSIDGIKIIATGSSVFDLSNKLGEPLVGRKIQFICFRLHKWNFLNKKIIKKLQPN